MRVICAAHEFSTVRHVLLYPAAGATTQEIKFVLDKRLFPFMLKERRLHVQGITVALMLDDATLYSGGSNRESGSREATLERSQISAPAISLPKCGGAIRGIGEKFAANSVTSTDSPLGTLGSVRLIHGKWGCYMENCPFGGVNEHDKPVR